ncbi:hypothetical protein [Azospirillum rugosum]|uniref:Uncharacterized protein n=1 Tax=Azospirillum rugosum TaxID=416170 RepID=A0ABS4SP77_9PROT|nr:hypothetical protein [Azospirillum rugosum]MBP2294363.1 hypothetical protein [Azospirillum rugosum]MDQ0527698.1 hypothetical protein [Azospirillum rugosum]
MHPERTWHVDFANATASSDAGTVCFAKSGGVYRITRTAIKSRFKGLHVRLCHQALGAIKASEHEERMNATHRVQDQAPSSQPKAVVWDLQPERPKSIGL